MSFDSFNILFQVLDSSLSVLIMVFNGFLQLGESISTIFVETFLLFDLGSHFFNLFFKFLHRLTKLYVQLVQVSETIVCAFSTKRRKKFELGNLSQKMIETIRWQKKMQRYKTLCARSVQPFLEIKTGHTFSDPTVHSCLWTSYEGWSSLICNFKNQ